MKYIILLGFILVGSGMYFSAYSAEAVHPLANEYEEYVLFENYRELARYLCNQEEARREFELPKLSFLAYLDQRKNVQELVAGQCGEDVTRYIDQRARSVTVITNVLQAVKTLVSEGSAFEKEVAVQYKQRYDWQSRELQRIAEPLEKRMEDFPDFIAKKSEKTIGDFEQEVMESCKKRSATQRAAEKRYSHLRRLPRCNLYESLFLDMPLRKTIDGGQ